MQHLCIILVRAILSVIFIRVMCTQNEIIIIKYAI